MKLYQEQQQYKAYPIRFLMLVLFNFPNICNSILWVTFSPISTTAGTAYGVDDIWIQFCSFIFLFTYIAVTFPSNFVIEHWGLRKAVLFGCSITIIGGWIRMGIQNSFTWVLVGEFVTSLGQPFITNAPSKMSQVWFPAEERAMATSFSTNMNLIGVGIGFLIPPAIVVSSDPEQARDQIYQLMWVEAVLVTVLCLSTAIFFRNEPPTPPSPIETNNVNSNMSNWEAAKKLTDIKDFNLVFIFFAFCYGIFTALTTLINYLVVPFGFSDAQSGLMGSLLIWTGAVGSFFTGKNVEKSRKYKQLMILFGIGGLVFNIALIATLNFNINLCIASMAIMGFFVIPIQPLGIELAAEVTYPLGEAFSAGFLMTSGQIVGIIMIFGLGQGVGYSNQTQCYIIQGVMLAFYLLGLLCMIPVQQKLKRFEAESAKTSLAELIVPPKANLQDIKQGTEGNELVVLNN